MSFEKAIERVNNLKKRPTDEQLLLLYGLYKQATIGDCNISQPWSIQIKERAKWEAWNDQIGRTTKEVKEEYIKLVNELSK